jgi:DNA invertase Pin-like site-specific DNA recombinase
MINRIAIYCRVSTADQNNATQKIALEKYARSKKWKFQTFQETESTRKTRPVKQKVLTLLRAKKFDAVLVYKLDRWARSTVELILEVKELSDKGIGFISLSDNIDFTTASGKLQFTILSAFAEFERSLISERTRAALAQKKLNGAVLGRPSGSSDKKPRRKSGYYVREYAKRTSDFHHIQKEDRATHKKNLSKVSQAVKNIIKSSPKQ